jgi:hypothetical protein
MFLILAVDSLILGGKLRFGVVKEKTFRKDDTFYIIFISGYQVLGKF